ncbi:hypothetical protein [Priestia filamentosa]|uniref:Uncharacterized protein n=1 Tax=Priestia filamentosa TaxID=1402861 RepID=A0A1X7E2Y7_9BACI|nr:hypothetical protein [Priestia filamentosa]AKO92311.1 hypothetical protein BEH_09530 [Priestia filamentosa]MDT3762351.1 hypothetical protein [Priestia filamentosa]OXS68914.1 hypothetical protein B1B01_07945 [Priestia filamentosa]RJS64382.1 hypothetical protein CJ485_06370 [Priestia filamentosa]WCM17425.1 hypothetical protein PGN40_08755 [Priestia filamentosa]
MRKKMYIRAIFELVLCLIIGWLLTTTMLKNIYESEGISYGGHEGVVWLGVSLLLFCIYTAVRQIFQKRNTLIKSAMFWIVVVFSLYVIVAPFIKGHM